MLVLSRRINEAIVFPELGITVRVVSLEKGRLRLGIEAPSRVTVLRAELLDAAPPEPPHVLAPV